MKWLSPTSLAFVSIAFGLVCTAALTHAEEIKAVSPTPSTAGKGWPVDKPAFPATLPGRGLEQHDFFYAGEAKAQDMYIIQKGKIAWDYHGTGKGEISDAILLPNGSILFAHQFGVTWIDADKKVLWNYDAPPQTEIHTAQPIGTDRVLFIRNGDPAMVFVANRVTGKMDLEFPLPVKNPKATHGHFRHARLTDAGTLLVAHLDMQKVAEYDVTGKEIWSVSPGIPTWSASRLKNGDTLISGGKTVREVNSKGATVWEFTSDDVPAYRFDSIQIATRLANGNTLINSWINQWEGKSDPKTAPVQALEVTPEKKVVWALRAVGAPIDLGPSTTLQLLDEPNRFETAHFGSLK